MIQRRDLLKLAGLFACTGLLDVTAKAAQAVAPQVDSSVCLAKQTELTTESDESPFFTHYHRLSLPTINLLQPPVTGITLQTSLMDLGSYDVEEFQKFTASSGIDPKKLLTHSHAVFISASDLLSIADGKKDVEVRVTSANKNYVHNFLITASPSTLVKVRRFKEGKIKA